jgi:hypothetical protein
MDVVFGPWITDPPVTYNVTFGWLGDRHSDVAWGQWRGIGMDFPTICDSGSSGGLFQVMIFADVAGRTFGGETDYDGNPIARGDLMGYQQGSLRFSFLIDTFNALPYIGVHSGLPEPAIDFQVEGHARGVNVSGDLSWITSDIDIVADHWTVNDFPEGVQYDFDYPDGYDTNHPLAGEVQYRINPTPFDLGPTDTIWTPLSTFESSADLAALPLLGSDTFTGSTVEYSPAITVPRTFLPTTGSRGRIEIVVNAKAVVDQTAPIYGALNSDNPGYDEQWHFIVRPGIRTGVGWPPTIDDPAGGEPPGCTYSVTFTYQRPRYRYVYSAAPADLIGASGRSIVHFWQARV